MSHTVGVTTTNYTWDVARSIPVVLQDGENTYVYGLDLISATDSQGDQTYFLYDGLGSVRGVTDDAGDLVGSAEYAVYGEVRASSGVSTLFGFTGEQYDAETGFTYLRARYMSPVLGRFVSADSVQPNAPGTQGWNLYA